LTPKVDVFFQYPLASGTSQEGWFRSDKDGYANIKFHEDYVVDVLSSSLPIFAYTHLKIHNIGDSDLYFCDVTFTQHDNPSQPAVDDVTDTRQMGTAAETYSSSHLRIRPQMNHTFEPTYEDSVVRTVMNYSKNSGRRDSYGLIWNRVTQMFEGNYAQDHHLMLPRKDWEEDADLITNGELTSDTGWTVADPSGVDSTEFSASGCKIYLGGIAEPNDYDNRFYGVFQCLGSGVSTVNTQGRIRTILFNYDETVASGTQIDNTLIISSSFVKTDFVMDNAVIIADSSEDQDGWEYYDGAEWQTVGVNGVDISSSDVDIRYTLQDNIPDGFYRYRYGILKTNNYRQATDYLDSNISGWQVESANLSPTMPSGTIPQDISESEVYPFVEICSLTSAESAYRLELVKEDYDVLSYKLDQSDPIDEVCYDGDILMYDICIDSLSIDPEGFGVSVTFTDDTECKIPCGIVECNVWKHIEVDLSSYAGKTYRDIRFRHDYQVEDYGYCGACFDNVKIMQNIDRLKGRQFLVKFDHLNHEVGTAPETWNDAISANHVFGRQSGAANSGENSNGQLSVFLRAKTDSGADTRDSYAYWYTRRTTLASVVPDDDTWYTRYGVVTLPANSDINSFYLAIGCWTQNTNPGGYVIIKDVSVRPLYNLYGECVYSLEETRNAEANTSTFRSVTDYGEKAWGIDVNGTYFEV